MPSGWPPRRMFAAGSRCATTARRAVTVGATDLRGPGLARPPIAGAHGGRACTRPAPLSRDLWGSVTAALPGTELVTRQNGQRLIQHVRVNRVRLLLAGAHGRAEKVIEPRLAGA